MGLDTVEFLMYAEKKFGITIDNNETSQVETMADFTALCYQKLLQKPNNLLNETQVFESLCETLRDKFAIKSEIRLQHKIVKDLGLG